MDLDECDDKVLEQMMEDTRRYTLRPGLELGVTGAPGAPGAPKFQFCQPGLALSGMGPTTPPWGEGVRTGDPLTPTFFFFFGCRLQPNVQAQLDQLKERLLG